MQFTKKTNACSHGKLNRYRLFYFVLLRSHSAPSVSYHSFDPPSSLSHSIYLFIAFSRYHFLYLSNSLSISLSLSLCRSLSFSLPLFPVPPQHGQESQQQQQQQHQHQQQQHQQ